MENEKTMGRYPQRLEGKPFYAQSIRENKVLFRYQSYSKMYPRFVQPLGRLQEELRVNQGRTEWDRGYQGDQHGGEGNSRVSWVLKKTGGHLQVDESNRHVAGGDEGAGGMFPRKRVTPIDYSLCLEALERRSDLKMN